jgi:hypothetical protein
MLCVYLMRLQVTVMLTSAPCCSSWCCWMPATTVGSGRTLTMQGSCWKTQGQVYNVDACVNCRTSTYCYTFGGVLHHAAPP